jgi:hypothetical protein
MWKGSRCSLVDHQWLSVGIYFRGVPLENH